MGLRQICSEARKFFADLNQLDPAEPGYRLENKNSSTNIPNQTPSQQKSKQTSKIIRDIPSQPSKKILKNLLSNFLGRSRNFQGRLLSSSQCLSLRFLRWGPDPRRPTRRRGRRSPSRPWWSPQATTKAWSLRCQVSQEAAPLEVKGFCCWCSWELF